MDYKQTLDWLYTQLPMYQRQGPKAFKKDLTNSLALDEALGHPHTYYPSIHVAGTNGKGTVAHMLSALLQEQGYRVGLYTSPHYRSFRERIKINATYINEQAVVSFVEAHRATFEKVRPSFFEITVAMAFWYFRENSVDIAVIETGLGGRLDSTNIIHPILSVITNIGFDHVQFLGNTLPKIATEKAGIIKPAIPVVVGETQAETRPVFERIAAQRQSPIFFAQDEGRCEKLHYNKSKGLFQLSFKQFTCSIHLPNAGPFQARNALTAFASFHVLHTHTELQVSLETEKIDSAFKNLLQLTRYQGRWQLIRKQPMTICDSAHNAEALSLIIQQLKSISFNKLHLVYGAVHDKSHDSMWKLLPQDAIYYFAKPDVPRGMNAEILQKRASEFQLHGLAYDSVASALQSATQAAQANDLILVTGSCYVVAEAIP